MRVVALIVAGFGLIGTLSSASAYDACNDILKEGIFDTSNQGHMLKETDFLYRYVCSRSQSSHAGSFSAIIYSIPVGAEYSDEATKASCEKILTTHTKDELEWLNIKNASQAIAAAWSGCMDGDGIRFSLEQVDDEMTVKGRIKFKSPVVVDAAAPCSKCWTASGTVKMPPMEAGFQSCTCSDTATSKCKEDKGALTFSVQSGGGLTFSCKRKYRGQIEAELSSDWGDRTATVDSLVTPVALMVGDTFVSGGKCAQGDGIVEKHGIAIAISDIDPKTPVVVSTIGNGATLSVTNFAVSDGLDGKKIELGQVVLTGKPKNKDMGLYIKVDDQPQIFAIHQAGNLDCPGQAVRKFKSVSIVFSSSAPQ